MTILGLIPARGGSKGIPRKNIKLMAGKPLIVWTIEAAMRCRRLDAVVVSTDDDEIAAVARHAGAQVPFMRPAALAMDTTPGLDPVLHALDSLPGHDAVLLLQPTSPLRSASDIDACLDMALSRDAPSVVSVCQVDSHPLWVFRMDGNDGLQRYLSDAPPARRQDLPSAYALNGAMYYARTAWLREHRAFVGPGTLGLAMPPERSVDVDTAFDWRVAEMLLKECA